MIHAYDNEGMFSPSLTHYSQSYRTLLRFARSTAFRCRQLGGSHLCITHPLQFLIGQFQASIHVIHIRPEINTESSRIRIGSQIGFDIIDQSSAFAKGHIQFTIHSGTSKDIIQQIECSTFVIIRIIATATDHNMRLMCISGHCQMFRHIQRRRCTAILYLHIRNIQQVFSTRRMILLNSYCP